MWAGITLKWNQINHCPHRLSSQKFMDYITISYDVCTQQFPGKWIEYLYLFTHLKSRIKYIKSVIIQLANHLTISCCANSTQW